MPQVALITGGSSGIGLATARRFARGGFDLMITGRDPAKLQSAAAMVHQETPDVRVTTIAADLCDRSSPKKIAEAFHQQFAQIDVLVNAAGFASSTPFGELTEAEFDATMETNIRSLFFLTQALWPTMVAQHSGAIVNISSLAALDPFPGFSAYGSSKAWVDLFTKALSNEGRQFGIRGYSIRPGAVETPMLRGLFPDFPAEQTVTAEEVAEVVWSVTTEPFRYSSGQAISVTRQ
ncbi:MAG: SDR family oxidoreductase [Pirellulaceae bacterium]|nr:SDR family oxidoreductase [Pirellulaceae bacterium]